MTPLERHHYVVRVLRMPGIPKAVLNCIEDHADKKDGCYLLQSTISAETGFSDRSVRRALSFLSKHGLILWVRHGSHASTFQLTLEAFQLAKARPATQAERNRPHSPTEVGPKKGQHRKPRKSKTQADAQRSADLAAVIHLFPEAKANTNN